MLKSLLAATVDTADEAWYERLVGWLGNVAEILTALVLSATILAAGWSLYKRTLDRRRDRYARLRRLGTNAQTSFFSSALGDPPAMRRKQESMVTRYDDDGNAYLEPKTWLECVWIDRDFYVHGVADEDETIHAYSVTTRTKRFRPAFRQPGAHYVERRWLARLLQRPHYKPNPKIRLGKTRFHELGRPEQAASWLGAHNAHYYESYWGANPGYYQYFVYSINDAGYLAWDAPWDYDVMHDFAWGYEEAAPFDPRPSLLKVASEADAAEAEALAARPDADIADSELAVADSEPIDDDYVDEPLPAFYDNFRRKARINTYTVIGGELMLDDYPFYTPPPQLYPTTFGVNSGRTRTLLGERGE